MAILEIMLKLTQTGQNMRFSVKIDKTYIDVSWTGTIPYNFNKAPSYKRPNWPCP